jgi:hypothetical protein
MTYLITVSKVHPITCHEGMGASQLYLFLTSELEGGGWSTPCTPNPLGKRNGTYCTGGWMSLGAGLNM